MKMQTPMPPYVTCRDHRFSRELVFPPISIHVGIGMKRLPLDSLSPREMTCLSLAAEMRSSKEIAKILGIAASTVDGYINEATQKLGVTSRRDAARLFIEHQAATPPRKSGDRTSRVEDTPAFEATSLGDGVPAQDQIQEDANDKAFLLQASPRKSPVRFHILRDGRANNDLTISQRLLWIAVVAVVASVLFASSAFVIEVLAKLMRTLEA